MALPPLGPAVVSPPAAPAARADFGQVLRGHLARPATAIPALGNPLPAQGAAAGAQRALGPRARPAEAAPGAATLERLEAAQHRMDEVLRLAESGRGFSPAELLALQAHVYRASQQLDLAGKVVEKATGGVKQILQTQV